MDRKSHTLSPDWNTGHSDVIEKSRHGGVHHSKTMKKREKKEYREDKEDRMERKERMKKRDMRERRDDREDKMERMRNMKGHSKKKVVKASGKKYKEAVKKSKPGSGKRFAALR